MAKQVDLFLDSLINAPLKDDRALMEFPFFSLQKQPRMEPIIYEGTNGIRIEVSPGQRGIATIWDKDVLIYIASLINDRIERDLPVDRTVRFNAYDLLRVTERGTGKDSYELLKDALFRLRSTTILTSIETGGIKEERGFGWIESWRIVTRTTRAGVRVMAAIEVTLNDWMFRAIVQDRRILSINREYFQLTQGLKRRLYELARKHCGRQNRWDILLPNLAEKCGSLRDLRFFKRDLKKIVGENDLPDYAISMSFDPAKRPKIEACGLDARRWHSNERIVVSFHPKATLCEPFSSTITLDSEDRAHLDEDGAG